MVILAMHDPAADRINIDGGSINYMEEAMRLQVLKEMELEARGYPLRTIHVAVERARGTARRRVTVISASIRDHAFYDIFKDELSMTENWITRVLKSLDDTRPDSDRYRDEEGGE